MPELTYRLQFVCPRCGDTHIKRGPIGFCMRGAAYILDQGSPMALVGNEGFCQELEMDFDEWLRCNGVERGEDLEWGGFSHGAGGPRSGS